MRLYKGLWLCIMNGTTVESIDGGHTRKSEIAKAKYLIDNIFGKDHKCKMVRVPKDFPMFENESWAQAIDRLVKQKILKLEPVPKNQRFKVNHSALRTIGSICKRKNI